MTKKKEVADLNNNSINELYAFAKYIASMELGCAPSAGYMESIILKARKIIETN